MSSETTRQLQEEREARRQQRERDGVLSKMSSPDQQKMGDAGTARLRSARGRASEQTARRLATDLKKDGTTTESWEAAKQEVADRGARYRDSLQPPTSVSDEALEDMRVEKKVADYTSPAPTFADTYDATTEFQEEEYGGGSLERESLVADIAGYDYVDKKGKKQRARGEDEKVYGQKYSEAKEENPDATEEELQDAALKAVMAYRARWAELDIDKILRESEVEATEDVGADLEREKTLEEREAEEAERLKKEADLVKGALDRGTYKTSKAKRGGRLEDVAAKTLGPELPPTMAAPLKFGFEGPELEGALESTDYAPGASTETVDYVTPSKSAEELEADAVALEASALPQGSSRDRVLQPPPEGYEGVEYSQYDPAVKEEVESRIITPLTDTVDRIYESPEDPDAIAANLEKFLGVSGGNTSLIGQWGTTALARATPRNDTRYYATLPSYVKKQLDYDALTALAFFKKYNRGRGARPMDSAVDALRSPQQKHNAAYRSYHKILRMEKVLERRIAQDNYESAQGLPNTFTSGGFVPFLEGGSSSVYSEESPHEELIAAESARAEVPQ